jgi:hypothetical protein
MKNNTKLQAFISIEICLAQEILIKFFTMFDC